MFIKQLLASDTVLSEKDTGVDKRAAVSTGWDQSLGRETDESKWTRKELHLWSVLQRKWTMHSAGGGRSTLDGRPRKTPEEGAFELVFRWKGHQLCYGLGGDHSRARGQWRPWGRNKLRAASDKRRAGITEWREQSVLVPCVTKRKWNVEIRTWNVQTEAISPTRQKLESWNSFNKCTKQIRYGEM